MTNLSKLQQEIINNNDNVIFVEAAAASGKTALIVEKINHRKITEEVRKNAIEWLSKVGLQDCIEKYPKQLSGGMRQRLALARTLYMKPQIILMDEPLSALDERTRAEMQQLILDIHKQTHNTIIRVTHSKEEANKMCDTILKF